MIRGRHKSLLTGQALASAIWRPPPAPMPYIIDVRGRGDTEATAAAAMGSWPSGVATDDIVLVGIETNTGQPGTISTAGWTQVTASPQDASDSCLAVYWARYAGGLSLPTINDAGDHMVAYNYAIRGCKTSGSPFNAVAGAVDSSSDTTIVMPGLVTTRPNCLIVYFVSSGSDGNNTDTYWSNFRGDAGSRVSPVVFWSRLSSVGLGGGFAVAVAGMPEPGYTGTSRCAVGGATTNGVIVMALEPTR